MRNIQVVSVNNRFRDIFVIIATPWLKLDINQLIHSIKMHFKVWYAEHKRLSPSK